MVSIRQAVACKQFVNACQLLISLFSPQVSVLLMSLVLCCVISCIMWQLAVLLCGVRCFGFTTIHQSANVSL